MKKGLLASLSIIFLFGSTDPAGAVQFTQSITHNIVSSGQNIDFTFTGFQGYPASDMTVEFWVTGDLDSSIEYARINVDENDYDFGNWLNDNNSDDIIDDAYGDIGNQCGSELYGSATIPKSELINLIRDGTLIVHWDFSGSVHVLCAQNYAKTTITYNYTYTIPTLSQWGFIIFVLLLAIAAVVMMKKRRNA